MGVLLPHELTSIGLLEQLMGNQSVTDNDPAVDPLLSASRIDLPMVVERLAGRHFPSVARMAISLAVLGMAGWHLRTLSRTSRSVGEDVQSLGTALAFLTIAICIYHNIYDGLLLGPTATLAWQLGRRGSGAQAKLARPLLICSAIVAANYLSSKQFVALLVNRWPAIGEASVSGPLWVFICTLNGLCLFAAWCLLLVMLRLHTVGDKSAPMQPTG